MGPADPGHHATPPSDGVQPGGRPPAPGELALVQDFVNSTNEEFDPADDPFGAPSTAIAWLARRGLSAGGAAPGVDELARAREAREALRALLAAQRDRRSPEPPATAALTTAAARAQVALRFDGAGGTPRLVAGAGGVDGAVGRVLCALHGAALAGTLSRLKACAQCGWAFYDGSRNDSGRWCSMQVCGGRVKRRAYKRRLRDR